MITTSSITEYHGDFYFDNSLFPNPENTIFSKKNNMKILNPTIDKKHNRNGYKKC
jgi:hypothetical protein